jgi:hypothetical protein
MRVDVRKILKKALKLLENHLGLVVLIVFVIAALYAAFVFYNFAYRPVTTQPETSFEKVKIEKDVFERVIERLELRKENISEAMRKEYSDVFR